MTKPLIHVLLIDDDIVDRKACQRALARSAEHDFALFEAETGREGLALACSAQPDCILLDYRLPDLDGLEFLAEVRDATGEIPTPVIMLTGADNAVVAVEAMKLGACDYLVKDLEQQYLALLPPVIGRVLGEQRLKTERKRLEEVVRKFSRVIEQTASTVLITDTRGIIEYVNPRFSEISGYPAQEVIGKRPSLLSSGHTPVEQYRQLWRTITGGGVWHGEFLNRRKDGSLYWESAIISPIRDEHGQITHFAAIKDDITERKRSEAALQAMQSEMELVMRFHVANQTVAALAHELNQPLNAVASYAEAALRLLNAGNPKPDKLQHAVERSAQQAQRAGQVVRELLAFLRKGDVQTEPVDLNDIVPRALARIEADAQGGFQTRLALDPALAPVTANRLQVEKVLANLVRNGVEAMHDAGIDERLITVTVQTSADGNLAQVTVRDSGPGIDDATLHRIFDPFFSTKPGGLGMGLAISRAIIESHGGQLWVEAEPGCGASFHFTLPFAP